MVQANESYLQEGVVADIRYCVHGKLSWDGISCWECKRRKARRRAAYKGRKLPVAFRGTLNTARKVYVLARRNAAGRLVEVVRNTNTPSYRMYLHAEDAEFDLAARGHNKRDKSLRVEEAYLLLSVTP